MNIGTGVIVLDIPPGPPPTRTGGSDQPVTEPTVAQPGTTPAAAEGSWSAGEITIALVVVVALVAAVVALSVYVARRPA